MSDKDISNIQNPLIKKAYELIHELDTSYPNDNLLIDVQKTLHNCCSVITSLQQEIKDIAFKVDQDDEHILFIHIGDEVATITGDTAKYLVEIGTKEYIVKILRESFLTNGITLNDSYDITEPFNEDDSYEDIVESLLSMAHIIEESKNQARLVMLSGFLFEEAAHTIMDLQSDVSDLDRLRNLINRYINANVAWNNIAPFDPSFQEAKNEWIAAHTALMQESTRE